MTGAAPNTRYILQADVLDVEERFEAVAWRKIDANNSECTKRSVGWFLRLSATASLYLGPDKPDLAAGDAIRITIEKVAA